MHPALMAIRRFDQGLFTLTEKGTNQKVQTSPGSPLLDRQIFQALLTGKPHRQILDVLITEL